MDTARIWTDAALSVLCDVNMGEGSFIIRIDTRGQITDALNAENVRLSASVIWYPASQQLYVGNWTYSTLIAGEGTVAGRSKRTAHCAEPSTRT